MQLRFLFGYNLFIFAGCLVIHIHCEQMCRADQYTVVTSNGSFLYCLNCGTCHRGRGLDPPCGRTIPDPPIVECKDCPSGTFSAELDSAPCHRCQDCAKHEMIAATCTNGSDKICNGTCENGYFYSKKDSTHSCQTCSYCCFDGKDEEVSECANQGLSASKQHCRPSLDKDCSPVPSPTDRTNETKASKRNNIIIGVISSVVPIVVVGLILLYRYLKKINMLLLRHRSAGERNENATSDPTGLLRHPVVPNLNPGYDSSRHGTPLMSRYVTPQHTDDSQPSREPIKIVKQPVKSQKQKEGSRVEFKFEVQGTSSLSYQWFKDGVELSEENNASLILECIKLRDFGCYTCQVSYQDGYGDIVKSSSAVLDVTPRCQNRMRLKYLSEVDFVTREEIATYLEDETPDLGGWRQIADKYKMKKHQIKALVNKQQPGLQVLDYLGGSNPDLTVYSFCKALKEDNMKRFDIVKVLEGHLSIKKEGT